MYYLVVDVYANRNRCVHIKWPWVNVCVPQQYLNVRVHSTSASALLKCIYIYINLAVISCDHHLTFNIFYFILRLKLKSLIGKRIATEYIWKPVSVWTINLYAAVCALGYLFFCMKLYGRTEMPSHRPYTVQNLVCNGEYHRWPFLVYIAFIAMVFPF